MSSHYVDPAALAVSIRDNGRVMLMPHEERALAIRVLVLEGLCSASRRHCEAVELANALNGSGDTSRDVQVSYEALRTQLDTVDATAAALKAAPRWSTSSPDRRARPLRQLTRWWRTMFSQRQTLRSSS
ncbi:hypothetical protein BN1012_Phect2623 [Candidatus Phaeomarinobacter ectocarpi]|uniref:Uncharacterized protein n=1 Tax=Candidatus Phaeomarinibacter ectocarpi TaxID=1458461 RepID=X5MP32_9HYPH|nr:hypothetical protein [Candidatus Phaeomarinobacter ectocarpi]CDO60836.1 hypothetical protein BN1012_Phect2623 [Candidatus Phaeomarinobacter ectocarpi]